MDTPKGELSLHQTEDRQTRVRSFTAQAGDAA
jgi:hypothetical protein